MKMEEKRPRLESPPQIKVEVKEENVLGNDYLVAKGRLQGVLKQLTEQSSSDSEDSDNETKTQRQKKSTKQDNRKRTDSAAPVRSTYLMKLYDRSVDLAKFEEDTPLYPICRAWMANNSKKQQAVVKRRLSSPEPESPWNSSNSLSTDIYRLPPPSKSFITRIPSPTSEQAHKDKDAINLNYEENAPVAKSELMTSHLQRWNGIKKKWIATAARNEERFTMSKQVLQTIYTKAQETMTE